MTLDARAKIIVSAVAEEAVREFRRLEQEAKRAAREGEKTSSSWDKLSDTLEKTSKAALAVGGGLTAIGTAAALFVGKATNLAARVSTMGVVTQQLGKNMALTEGQVRATEQSVVDMGITLSSARGALARMSQAEIDWSHASQLARLAQDAAVISLQDSSATYEQLIHIISTGNIRMGRTIGLQLNFQKSYENLATTLGVTTEELTEQQRVQARVNEVLDKGVNISGAYEAAMGDVGKQALSLNRHWEESRRIIGEAFLPEYGKLVTVTTDTLEAFQGLTTAQQNSIAAGIATAAAFSAVSGAALLLVSQGPAIIATFQSIGVAAGTALGPISAAAVALAYVTTTVVAARAGLRALRQEFTDSRKAVLDAAGSYDDYVDRVVEASESTALWEFASRLAHRTGRDFDEVLRELLEDQGMLTESQFKGINSVQGWTKAHFEAYRGIRQMTEGQEEAITTTQKIQDEFDAWKDGLDRTRDAIAENKTGLQAFASSAQGIPSLVATRVVADTTDADERLRSILRSLERIQGAHVARVRLEGAHAVLAQNQQLVDLGIIGTQMQQDPLVTKFEQLLGDPGGGQHGGRLRAVNMVGEAGPELVINGVVIDTSTTRKLMALGLRPTKQLAVAGPLDGAIGEGPSPLGGHQQLHFGVEAFKASQSTGGGGSGSITQQDSTAMAVEAAQEETAQQVERTISGLAAVLPSSQDIGAAVSREARQERAEQLRANRELIAVMKEVKTLLEDQATNEGVGLAIRDSIATVAG